MTPSDILATKVLSDAQISPDGSLVALVVADNFKEEGAARPHSNIWIVETATGATRQFSSGPRTDYMPRWSPDGSSLAFLSDRSESSKFHVYLLPRSGGEARQLTSSGAVGEILQIDWSRSGDKLAILMYDGESREDKDRKDRSGGAIEFEKHHKYARIYVIDAKTGSIEWRSTGNYHIWEFSWSPDEKRFAALVADEPYEWSWHISSLAVIDREARDEKPRILYTPRPKQLAQLLWSRDGATIFFISAIWSDRGLVAGDLYRISAAGGPPPVNITNDKLGSVHFYTHGKSGDEELVVLSVDWAKTKFTSVQIRDSKFRTLYEGEVALSDWYQPEFSISHTSSRSLIAGVGEDLFSPQEAWIGKIEETEGPRIEWKRVTEFNANLKDTFSKKFDARSIQWKSSEDGLDIQGFLYRPADAMEEKLPLIVNEHGGPSLGYGYRFAIEARYYASHGYAVLLPNPRGSAGRGVRFLESNRGNIDGKDFKDIMSGVDYCEAQGWVEPNNEFVYGGSYGGYLVAWTLTHTNRFNAAVMDFGIANLLSCHGTEWNTYWEMYQFDIDPYKQMDLFEKKSPISYVTSAKTPTLIIHGKEDLCVPVSQGHEFFRALKELGVETELVIYPREGHGWVERKHKVDAWQRHLDWFEKHKCKTSE